MAPKQGSIQWFFTNASEDEPTSRPFKRPRIKSDQLPSKPHLALRSSNHCQQLLAQELGWRCSASLNSWHLAQQQQLSCICFRTRQDPAGFRTAGSRSAQINCLEVQQPNSSSSGSRLVAAVDSTDVLHICSLSQLHAASESALNAAAALPPDVREALLDPITWARRAAAVGVPVGGGALPTAPIAAVRSIVHGEQLRSCCWLQQQHNGAAPASSSEGVLVVSAGRTGLSKWVFAQARQASSSLRAKGGSMVEAAGAVVPLDCQASYQLAAVSSRSLLLWDLRCGPAAAAQLPVPAAPSVLKALPGGQLLLTGEPSGQVCLYDVRRLSSSTIVNFGSSRGSQQLLVSHNLKARAQAAGYSSVGSIVSYGVAHEPQFLSGIAVNPADPNLMAYIKPQLQAGLFDLCSGNVVQQVALLETLDAPASSSNSSSSNSSQGFLSTTSTLAQTRGHCCWDGSGRVLYTPGLLQYALTAAQLAPGGGCCVTDAATTLAAVDFGSWHGRGLRWGSSSSAQQTAAVARAGAGVEGEPGGTEDAGELVDDLPSQEADACREGSEQHISVGSTRRWQGAGRLYQGGQVLHREVHRTAAPSVVAAAGEDGEVLVGTASGDVLWLR